MEPDNDPTIQDSLRPGTMLGRYEIRRLIGRGGMGSVYEATHVDLKKRVAVKTLLPSLAANSDARTRFLREGEAASRIQHPHVVNVTDVGAEGTTIFLVMEYLEGEDLAKMIARQGALPVAQTVDIMLPVAAAISTAHEQGVIHRDLKPENVFLSLSTFSRIHPKVLDFGISKVTGDRNTMVLTGTGATFGTMFYLPPEQLQGARQADAKSDQYALGTILYECVTGQRAFERENLYAVMKDIAEGRYIPPRERRPDLPDGMTRIITRAMSLQPAGRFPSVLELGAALLEFAGPNARAVWAPFFSGHVTESEGPRTPQPLVAGGTMVLPPEGAGFPRLGLTPPPRGARGPAQSTFGHATGESRMPGGVVPDLRRSRAPLFTVIGLAVIAGVTALALGPGANIV
ncbi:MAG: serine/threonine-protein kinase, partial [Pseudomonadota bacterium]